MGLGAPPGRGTATAEGRERLIAVVSNRAAQLWWCRAELAASGTLADPDFGHAQTLSLQWLPGACLGVTAVVRRSAPDRVQRTRRCRTPAVAQTTCEVLAIRKDTRTRDGERTHCVDLSAPTASPW